MEDENVASYMSCGVVKREATGVREGNESTESYATVMLRAERMDGF